MFCSHCGKEIDDHAAVCPHCGYATKNYPAQPSAPQTNPEDKSSFAYALLGFFIPLVGLILFCLWNREYPRRAKSAGVGALVGFLLHTLLSLILDIIFGASVFGLLFVLLRSIGGNFY